jgi:hypothetical protein
MKTYLPRDTSLEALSVQFDLWGRLPLAERARRMFQLGHNLETYAASGVRSRHPEYSAEQVRLAVIRLRIGDRLFQEAYPNVEVYP